MLKLIIALIVVTAPIFLIWFGTRPADPSTLPRLDPEEWWGPKETEGKADTSIRPFKVEFREEPDFYLLAFLRRIKSRYDFLTVKIPTKRKFGFGSSLSFGTMIVDLKRRLDNFRAPPPPLEGVAQQYGFNSKLLDFWRSYWRNEYPFKKREEFLNQYPQFKTNIQGLDMHFIHVKPKVPAGVKVLPLLLLHGWPGSVREFYETIPLLARQAPGYDFAFEVIVPSLPGYGFSGAAVRPGLGAAQMSVVFCNLMRRLGHEQFYLQGGDFGAIIGYSMVTFFPDTVLGFHSNMLMVRNSRSNLLTLVGALWPTLIVPEKRVPKLYPMSEYFSYMLLETGYLHIQATKPDTIGVGFSDSPLGLLAYIFEKFTTGTRRQFRDREDGGLLDFYTRDHLLDNLMIYWSTNCKTTAMRLYAETFNKAHSDLNIDRYQTTVPTWAIQASNDFYHPPTILRTKYINLLGATELEDSGHFLALEKPDTLVQDVFKAVKAFLEFRASTVKTEL